MAVPRDHHRFAVHRQGVSSHKPSVTKNVEPTNRLREPQANSPSEMKLRSVSVLTVALVFMSGRFTRLPVWDRQLLSLVSVVPICFRVVTEESIHQKI